MMCSLMLLWASVKTAGVLILTITGCLGQDWSVTHTPSKICAFQHTSLALPCKFTYPRGQAVTISAWYYKKWKDAEPVVVSEVQNFGEHAEDNCSLTLNNLTQDNAGIYQFSFRTNILTQNLTNEHGVTLEITDLEVEMVSKSDIVLADDWVMLMCGTCIPSVTLPTYIWHKDGRPHSRKRGDNQLELLQVRPGDAGSYLCSIEGHEYLRSSAVTFTVHWPPKNFSVSISPSGEIVEGSSVNLTCSSDGNPPVKIYTWFKGSTPAGTENTYTILNIRSEDSGEYTCQSRNEVGERRSTAVKINVEYPPKSVSVSISFSGNMLEGRSVTLTCSSDANPPVKNYTWFKEGGTSPVGSGSSYYFSLNPNSSGFYSCEVQNEHGALSSALVLVSNAGQSPLLYVAVGGGFCGVAALLTIGLCLRSKRQKQKRKTDKTDLQKTEDDTYTALDLTTRSSDNVYETLEVVHPGPPGDTTTSGQSDYENVATLNKTDQA